MKSKSNTNLFSRSFLIISVCLIAFWFVFSICFINKVSFSVVTYKSINEAKEELSSLTIYKDKKYQGEFKARDNNLGIIMLELDPNKTKFGGKDVIKFKFKEKGKKFWEYQTSYNLALFDSQSSFSFGLPTINNSKSRVYQFEISSTAIDEENHVRISEINTFITGYQYDRSQILKVEAHSASFLFNKVVGSFSDPDFVKQSLIYLIPFIFFQILCITLLHVKLPKRYLRLLSSPDIGNINNASEAFSRMRRITIIGYKLDSRSWFIFSFIVIIVWLILIPFGFKELQKQLNVGVYMLLLFGCVHLFIEERRNDEKKKP